MELRAIPVLTRWDELFNEWLAGITEFPNTLDAFSACAFYRLEQGYKHYSARACLERVRWEIDVGPDSPKLKLNNNHTPFFGRWWEWAHPEHVGFLRFRIQPSHDRKPKRHGAPTHDELDEDAETGWE